MVSLDFRIISFSLATASRTCCSVSMTTFFSAFSLFLSVRSSVSSSKISIPWIPFSQCWIFWLCLRTIFSPFPSCPIHVFRSVSVCAFFWFRLSSSNPSFVRQVSSFVSTSFLRIPLLSPCKRVVPYLNMTFSV